MAYIILVQKLKERIVIGNVYCICKNESYNSVFQPSENTHFDNVPQAQLWWAIVETSETLRRRIFFVLLFCFVEKGGALMLTHSDLILLL